MAYTEDEIEKTFNSIIKAIENGESLRACLRKENSPSSQTFFRWIDEDKDKSKQYARAVSIRAEGMFDEMLEIADTTEEGVTIKETDKGVEKTIGDMIQHRRLKVDTRKWALARMNPKKYGDKMQQDINIKSEQPLFGDG